MRFRDTIRRGCAVLGVSVVAHAVVLAQSPTPPRAAPGATEGASDLRIQIEVPAQLLEAGRDLGFVALLTNTSSSEVRMRGTSVTLTVPVALDPQGWQAGWHAFFPTIEDEKEFVLQPGDAYRVFWTVNRDRPTEGPQSWLAGVTLAMDDLLNPKVMFFEPGDYSVVVNAKFWTMADGTGPYRTVTATTSLPVAAPMLVVLAGAAVGGVISFVLMPALKLRKTWQWKRWTVRSIATSVSGALGSALLSVIVTILISRISSTEFFFQVTVNDVWGAVAVGFFGPLAAGRLFDKIAGNKADGEGGDDTQADGAT